MSFLVAINLTSVVHRKFENGSKIMKSSIMFQPRLETWLFLTKRLFMVHYHGNVKTDIVAHY